MNRYRGFSLDAEWATESYEFRDHDGDFDRQGWRVQAGYMVVPGKFEVAARYAENQRLRPATYRASIDSGLLVAEMSQASQNLKTFSTSFDDQSFDETKYAKACARAT